MEDLAHHSDGFLQMKLAVVGHNPRRILSPVLQHDEAVIEILDHVPEAGDSEDPAHIRRGGKKIYSKPPPALESRK